MHGHYCETAVYAFSIEWRRAIVSLAHVAGYEERASGRRPFPGEAVPGLFVREPTRGFSVQHYTPISLEDAERIVSEGEKRAMARATYDDVVAKGGLCDPTRTEWERLLPFPVEECDAR